MFLVNLALLAYKTGTALVAPPVCLFLRYRRKKPPYGKRAREFLGFVPKENYEHPLWFHTVSVGESMGAIPLIKQIAESNPNLQIVVTTMTTTAMQLYSRMPPNVKHLFVPLDSPCAVKRFINRVNPRGLIIMETELWPNLLSTLHQRNIPVMLINARLSERSTQKYKKLGLGFMSAAGQYLSLIACQSTRDQANFLSLGIPKENTIVTGSLKFDVKFNNQMLQESENFLKQIGERPVLTAASTHEGEDQMLLDIYGRIKQKIPNLLLFLIPRHPERFNSVYKLCCDSGYQTHRRTERTITIDTNILLGDTMGELPFYFGCSTLILMCGSLIDIGGHNPLEAIACNKPVITGPYIRNFRKIFMDLEKQEATVIGNLSDLPKVILSLLENPQKLQTLSKNASRFLEENKGATEKTLVSLKHLMNL